MPRRSKTRLPRNSLSSVPTGPVGSTKDEISGERANGELNIGRNPRRNHNNAAPALEIPGRSVTPIGKTLRLRDRDHLKVVTSQLCLACGRSPSDAHHLKFAQGRALA